MVDLFRFYNPSLCLGGKLSEGSLYVRFWNGASLSLPPRQSRGIAKDLLPIYSYSTPILLL